MMKTKFRKSLKHQLSLMSESEIIKKSANIQSRCMNYIDSVDHYNVLIYMSFISEVRTNILIKELFSNEWKNKIVVTDRKLKLSRPKNYLDLVQTEKIQNNFLNEINQNGCNAYSLNNAISYYYSHQAGSKNIKSESEKARIRTENNLYGKANAILNKSKELCLAI